MKIKKLTNKKIFTTKEGQKLSTVFQKPEMEILPGNLAFSLVLSIVPIITLFVFFASFFNISIASFINFMNRTFPREVSKILVPIISGKGFNFNVGLFIIIGFVIASNGLYSVIIASNTLYQIDESSKIKRRIKAFILSFVLVFLFLFILIVLAFGNVLIKLLLSFISNKETVKLLYSIFVLLKWPISFVIIFFTINFIYAIAPDISVTSKNTRKGAVFTTFSWLVATSIYSYYASNIANYDIFYGSLSSIMVLMIWAYILSYVFVLGIAINTYNLDLNDKY